MQKNSIPRDSQEFHQEKGIKSPSFPDNLPQKLLPGYLLVITIGGVALAEIFAMAVLYYVRHWDYRLMVLADASILAVTIFPLLYLLLVRPLLSGIEQRTRAEKILQSRLRLMEYANRHSLDDLQGLALDEVEGLTASQIGFFHFVSEDQKSVILRSWSTNTVQKMCSADGKGAHYDLETAGVWADAVRTRRPVLHNDYASLPDKKGLPPGHARIRRELVVPILRGEKVVAVLGVGNKDQDYTPEDVELVSTFADFAWDIVQHVKSENAIHENEEKFRTLVDWTYDWELWKDPEGRIIYSSPSCERITGYASQEFIRNPDLIFQIMHPEDGPKMKEHDKLMLETSGKPLLIEYRLIARDGSEHWIEHRCRPLFDSKGRHLGRRITNRDISERKRIEETLKLQAEKEGVLTRTLHNLQTEIGRDLHDTLGNQISYLRMNLEHLSETEWSDPHTIQQRIQQMSAAANDSYEMVRAMLAILQAENLAEPLSLFTRYAEQIAERSFLKSEVASRGVPHPLTLNQIRQLYYIFREALGNIEKYARARCVSTSFIWEDQCLCLVVADDGSGFDLASVPTSGHYGLKFMRERAALMKGSLDIHSVPGTGTTVTVTIPYESAAGIEPARQNQSD
jgi:PAS domain S-box-containing protein